MPSAQTANSDQVSDAAPLFRVENLVVSYGPIGAVRGIDLEVRAGEIVTVLGPNGAGKSTTLLSIVGLVPPSGGTIAFNGKAISGNVTEAIVREGVTLVPEGRHVFRNMTVAENLRLGAATTDRNRAHKIEAEALELFPRLKERYHVAAGYLSGGEQQQLAIARALMCQPKLLLLDEPSLGLAPILTTAVFESIARLRAGGLTVLLVEQNLSRAMELADRAYVMVNGRVLLTGPTSELTRSDIEAAYFADPRANPRNGGAKGE
jgi:branched-chain amino acid transport system ATP-binding protein